MDNLMPGARSDGPPTRDADLMRTALDCVDVVWAQDADGRLTYISPAIATVTGYPLEQHLGRRWAELWWIERAETTAADGAVFAAHQPFHNHRMTVVHRDGSRRILTASGRPGFDADGRFLGYRGTIIDITDTVRTETIFRQISNTVRSHVGQDYLHALVRTVAEILHVDWVFVGRIAGEQRDRVRTVAAFVDGQPVADLDYTLAGTPCHAVAMGRISVHASGAAETFPDDPPLVQHGIQGYCGLPLFDTQGQVIGLLCVLSTQPLREAAMVCSVLQIFTARAALELERQSVEDALRRSERRFRALIEHSNDLVTVLRPDGVISYLSPSSVYQLQYGLDELIGTSVFAGIHPDDAASFAAAFHQVATQPDGSAMGRCRVGRRDGTWRHFAWSARNALDVPEIDGIILNSRDVTEEVRLEEQLRQAQKMEVVGQLAGGIAHDFNNIVGGILGFATFLTEDLPKGSPEHRLAERIVGTSVRAKELVQHILAFSRRSGVERRLEDIAALVLGAEGLLRAALPSSTRLDVRAEHTALTATVNASQIERLLLNLCVNANDALDGEPGSVTLTVTRVAPGDADHTLGEPGTPSNRTVSGSLDPRRSYARIVVADSGIGMSPEILDRAFNPFFSTKERGRGTGLGLAIVHGVVMECGGACRIDSVPGRGTVFSVYIPLEAGAAPPAPIAPDRPPARGRERILVIDDEADVADVFAIGLDRLGYRVTTIGDPLAALAAFEQDPDRWDVVISDQVMPGIKGMNLFARLKAIKPSLRFILCTGFSDVATEANATPIGIDGFFTKPVSPQQLAARIREIIGADVA